MPEFHQAISAIFNGSKIKANDNVNKRRRKGQKGFTCS